MREKKNCSKYNENSIDTFGQKQAHDEYKSRTMESNVQITIWK